MGLFFSLYFFFPLKQCVGAEEKLIEELQESIVIKTLPSTQLFLREALDAFAFIPNLVKNASAHTNYAAAVSRHRPHH